MPRAPGKPFTCSHLQGWLYDGAEVGVGGTHSRPGEQTGLLGRREAPKGVCTTRDKSDSLNYSTSTNQAAQTAKQCPGGRERPRSMLHARLSEHHRVTDGAADGPREGTGRIQNLSVLGQSDQTAAALHTVLWVRSWHSLGLPEHRTRMSPEHCRPLSKKTELANERQPGGHGGGASSGGTNRCQWGWGRPARCRRSSETGQALTAVGLIWDSATLGGIRSRAGPLYGDSRAAGTSLSDAQQRPRAGCRAGKAARAQLRVKWDRWQTARPSPAGLHLLSPDARSHVPREQK